MYKLKVVDSIILGKVTTITWIPETKSLNRNNFFLIRSWIKQSTIAEKDRVTVFTSVTVHFIGNSVFSLLWWRFLKKSIYFFQFHIIIFPCITLSCSTVIKTVFPGKEIINMVYEKIYLEPYTNNTGIISMTCWILGLNQIYAP